MVEALLDALMSAIRVGRGDRVLFDVLDAVFNCRKAIVYGPEVGEREHPGHVVYVNLEEWDGGLCN